MIRITYFPRETYVVRFLICVFKCLCDNIGDCMGEILFDLISSVFIDVRSQYWWFILIL